MSREAANARVLELMSHYGSGKVKDIAVEFFFYSDRQDDAGNLAIELHRLGYEIYGVTPPDTGIGQWSVIGVTPAMSQDEDTFNQWTDRMEQLAEENNSRFDGWGTLVDPE